MTPKYVAALKSELMGVKCEIDGAFIVGGYFVLVTPKWQMIKWWVEGNFDHERIEPFFFWSEND